MKKLRRIGRCLALGMLCVGVSIASADDASLIAKLEAALTRLTQDNPHGVAVLVARDGQVVARFASGMADVERKIPVTPDTKFRIGSVTKQFVAAAILRLAEEGRLALDDHLVKYFPGFPGGEKISIQQLLNHTSGIHSYTDDADFLSRVSEPVTPKALIEKIRQFPPDFAPGEGFHYNNSAYFLAGEIVAQVSGQSLPDYLRATFFEPLEMQATGIYDNAAPPANIAKGYEVKEGKSTPALDWDMSWAGGAGALYSTLDDLFRWNEALYDGRVLQSSSLKTMLTPVSLGEKVDGMVYGCGVLLSSAHRLPCVSHSGGLNGWSSVLMRLPEQKATIVVLVNALPAKKGLEPGAIADGITAAFFAEEIAKQSAPEPNLEVDSSHYAWLTGRYAYKDGVMVITVEEGRLMAQLADQPKLEIFPQSSRSFFWKEVDASVTFLGDDKTPATAARHTQGGNIFTAPRLPDRVSPELEAELSGIVGQYQYGPGVVLTVTRKSEQVFAQLTGQPQYPIFRKANGVYEWKVVAAQVKFVKDDTGKVTKAVHQQSGATFEAPKVK